MSVYNLAETLADLSHSETPLSFSLALPPSPAQATNIPKKKTKKKKKKKICKCYNQSISEPLCDLECNRCDTQFCENCPVRSIDGCSVCSNCYEPVECECACLQHSIDDFLYLDSSLREMELVCEECGKTVCDACLIECEECADQTCKDCMVYCGECDVPICKECGAYCEGCEEWRCCADNEHDVHIYDEPLAMESWRKNGRFVDRKCDSNCLTCRGNYAFMGYYEF